MGSRLAICRNGGRHIGRDCCLFLAAGNLAFVSHFQCEAHSGNSGADHKEIEFSNHDNVIYGCKGKENLFSLYILMLLFAAFF
jgi:hypothetical protein